MKIFNNKYRVNYNTTAYGLASGSADFLPACGHSDGRLMASSLERARRNLARNAQSQVPEKLPDAHLPEKPEREPEYRPEHKPERKPERQSAAPKAKHRRTNKRPPVILACVTGVILSAVLLLALSGAYGAYCFAKGLPGDASVHASTMIYCCSVLMGCFWASALVKRRTLKPVIFIGGVHWLLSLIISAQLFELAEFKISMILLKIVITALAAGLGYLLSFIPYLINRAIKRQRQKEKERRARRQAA
ncbi:MAG: hypothetical protein IJB67_04550 [Firmicutes bacterium]|nr:hypothetical protein [Bacillota bacterium]